jgi:hypothetical protein
MEKDLSGLSAQQIEDLVKEQEATAALLPPGKIRQAIFLEITRLRTAAALRRTDSLLPRDAHPG